MLDNRSLLLNFAAALLASGAAFVLAGCSSGESDERRGENPDDEAAAANEPVLKYTMPLLSGEQTDLAEYTGDVVLIVNTASRCGLTPQYADLQELYDQYKDRGFVVLGFPSNDYNNQEPGDDQEIAAFCEENYGVTFPMFSKIKVSGPEPHPLYQQLAALPGELGGTPKWNFTKFLVGREGTVVARFEPATEPTAKQVTSAIERLLAQGD